eukprot:8396023-Pyramimonas_sp.AAC.1
MAARLSPTTRAPLTLGYVSASILSPARQPVASAKCALSDPGMAMTHAANLARAPRSDGWRRSVAPAPATSLP